MPLLDANVILRYLLNDVPDMSEQARTAILAGAATTPEVLAEVVYVLAGVYRARRSMIAQALTMLLDEIEVSHKPALLYALRLYADSRLDFVDCLLAGYHHVEGQSVVTFDKKLQKALASDPIARNVDNGGSI